MKGQKFSNPPMFDEKSYLAKNPDVRQAVVSGSIPSGLFHYVRFGHQEKRGGVDNEFQESFLKLYELNLRLPTPPTNLRKRVHGDESNDTFHSLGNIISLDIDNNLKLNGIDLFPASKVLDFGCGSGRVARWFTQVHPQCVFTACDIDQEAIFWCQANLSSVGKFFLNDSLPPLNFPDEHFDFVYAISIFTHLPEDLQLIWLKELKRVTKRGGTLFISVHGSHLFPSKSLLRRLVLVATGFFYSVENGTEGLPSFYQTSYHTRHYVSRVWGRYFSIERYVKKGIAAHQDLVICKRTK